MPSVSKNPKMTVAERVSRYRIMNPHQLKLNWLKENVNKTKKRITDKNFDEETKMKAREKKRRQEQQEKLNPQKILPILHWMFKIPLLQMETLLLKWTLLHNNQDLLREIDWLWSFHSLEVLETLLKSFLKKIISPLLPGWIHPLLPQALVTPLSQQTLITHHQVPLSHLPAQLHFLTEWLFKI